ncbi:MAG: bifunctional 5,10-methylenetetrahydrofolate dehydrogenase/5,10-methenyltetrahydrofolate cyclohydrolase [Phycisphaerae bacterium]|jgi:methylenetetrahydrofolate dehydrogenase (NADP+)/methenyltetrahydrofolate cyclohydrolase|nr:bifunctional 5,10-methylenetetrahydrofolate dehydrogenase/5,10-methenyltetrahydrofolate cyclohydrolase [Phycisphaerae bacterium]
MPARILDGAAYAAEIRTEVTRQVAWYNAHHGPIKLCAVLVGTDEAGRLYAGSQRHLAVKVGVQYDLVELPESTTQAELLATLDRLNADPTVTGILLQLPLPPHIEPAVAQYHIDPYKDVEGVNPANIGLLFYGEPLIAPCTALAVTELIRRSGVVERGAHAVVVGQSRIVGRPVTMFLLTHEATVTGCHIATRNLSSHTRAADILVVAMGQPRAIGVAHVKPGAVVIDVGIHRIKERDADGREVRRTVGDVDFAAVREVASALTPVPGGVGPLTVAMLLRNTVEAAQKQLRRGV